MGHASRSAAAFGTYLTVLGFGITWTPGTMRDLFNKILVSGQLPPVGDGDQSLWIRAFGIVTAYVGLFYLQAARHDLRPIFELTAFSRTILLPAIYAVLYVSGKVPITWLEAAIPADFVTALHMIWALRRDRLLKP